MLGRNKWSVFDTTDGGVTVYLLGGLLPKDGAADRTNDTVLKLCLTMH